MTIDKIEDKNITLRLNAEESQNLINLLSHARRAKNEDLTAKDYRLCASLIMANSLLKNGCLPSFEFNLITELREKANKMTKPIN